MLAVINAVGRSTICVHGWMDSNNVFLSFREFYEASKEMVSWFSASLIVSWFSELIFDNFCGVDPHDGYMRSTPWGVWSDRARTSATAPGESPFLPKIFQIFASASE